MRQFNTVLKFELMSYFKSKPYRITTAVMVGLVLLLCLVPIIISQLGLLGADQSDNKQPEDSKSPTGVYDIGGTLSEELLNTYLGEGGWELFVPSGKEQIGDLILSERYSFVIEVNGLDYTVTEPGSGNMNSRGRGTYDDMVKQGWQTLKLTEKGLSQTDVNGIVNAAPESTFVSVGKDAGESYLLGIILLMALYIAILMYGQYVVASVITEKSTKTVELLIISVKPVYLIFGKVIGAGLAGLTQLSVTMLAGLVGMTFSRSALASLFPAIADMLGFSGAGVMLLYALIFFLLGFFIFAFLYAGFASTVNRMEDANSIIMMPMLIFVAAFLVAVNGMSNPAATYVTVCSYIPFLSPLIMFMRICMTDVPFYQIMLAIVIDVASVLAVGIVSARVYRTGVMMYGSKPTMRSVWRILRGA